MNERERLPQRRVSETVEFKAREIDYRATLGYYDDGRIGEVFLNGGKLDSGADIIAREAAICLSLALQFGCPLDVAASAFPRTAEGAPEGPLGALVDHLEQEKST